jgi:N-methylhydantoinase A/oxoprolinase/acetone carboxylase beta subunit
VLCPIDSGVLSAFGLAAAAPRRDASGAPEATDADALIERVSTELGQPPARIRVRYELRYRGQSFELPVEAPPDAGPQELRALFEDAHQRRFGYLDPEAAVDLITIRVSAWGEAPVLDLSLAEREPRRARTSAWFDGARTDVALLDGPPRASESVEGPAIIALGQSTLVVEPGWSAQRNHTTTLTLGRSQ